VRFPRTSDGNDDLGVSHYGRPIGSVWCPEMLPVTTCATSQASTEQQSEENDGDASSSNPTSFGYQNISENSRYYVL